ncbi:MAG: cytochrome c [Acetobacteraceae bacterium]|jgi:cytochrome c|nr:cytochrome c [Acetobacteraceae bacterium]
MTPGLSMLASRLVLLGVALAPAARAQFLPPVSSASSGPDTLFRDQCGTCHVLSAKDGPRQGPPLGGVFGRRAGSVPGFKYSDGVAAAAFDWDAQRLDTWLANPQAVIPGAVMAYRQPNSATRHTIIDWLKEQH